MGPMKDKRIIKALRGQGQAQVPFWLMRQAGRYLPEYRAVREKAGGFLNLAFTPELAAEVTVQPLRRYGMDAAILFSDILVIPYALGQDLKFETGEGPVLGALPARLESEKLHDRLAPVYDAVRAVRSKMADEKFHETALIGFAGAPFTVACYMLEGGGSDDGFQKAQKFMRQRPAEFSALMDTLTQATASYLIAQVKAGAEILQLFESWAGVLSGDKKAFAQNIINPAAKIVTAYPDIPLIGFPRGAGDFYADYATGTGFSGIGLDQSIDLNTARKLQKTCTVQGNLDPQILLAGGAELIAGTRKILDGLAGGPFVFNLGHGVIKETPPENVTLLAQTIREYK